MSHYQQAEIAASLISPIEVTRAEALELILREDTFTKAQRDKQEVIDEVRNMHERYPIDFRV